MLGAPPLGDFLNVFAIVLASRILDPFQCSKTRQVRSVAVLTPQEHGTLCQQRPSEAFRSIVLPLRNLGS